MAGSDGQIASNAPVQQLPRLGLRGRSVAEGIAAGVVIDLVLADVRIDGQQRMGTEGVLEAGGDVPGEHALVLILPQLIIAVGDLEPVARGEEVQVERVAAVGLIVEAIEDAFVVALIVESGKLVRVQETAAAPAVNGDEVPRFRAAKTAPGTPSGRAKRPKGRVPVAKVPHLSEARARGDIGQQAGLVAKLRG